MARVEAAIFVASGDAVCPDRMQARKAMEFHRLT
jgi:hypothetical protein